MAPLRRSHFQPSRRSWFLCCALLLHFCPASDLPLALLSGIAISPRAFPAPPCLLAPRLPVSQPSHGDLRAALVGRTILYWRPEDGWHRGTVARLCPRGALSHVVAYTRQTSVLRGAADTLARRRHLRRPMGAALPGPWCRGRPRLGGSGPPLWLGPPTLTFSLVGGWASGPARVGGRCGNSHLADAFLRLQRTAVVTAVLYRASPRDARENLKYR